MNFGDIILILIKFAGAVVVFIYGMKLMSEGLQKAAGSKMRSIMSRMTGNRFHGIVTGAAVTAAVQSSTATTVMVVGFVNSGLLTLAGAIAVIMGANIGTTFTSWIILLGMSVGAAEYTFPLIVFALAAPLLLMEGDKARSISEFVIGFGILLVVLGNIMPKVRRNSVFGLRTKWSLANDRVWQKSQRFGGFASVAAGFLLIFLAFLVPGIWNSLALLAVILVWLIVCVLASRRYGLEDRKAQQKKEAGGAE